MRNRYKKIIGSITTCIVCFVMTATVAAQQENVVPEQKKPLTQIIKVHHKTGIQQPSMKISLGTTVIWFNESDSLIEIQFTDKQVTMVCANPVNFILDVNGTFVSNKIPKGALASICFVEKGSFDYSAQNVSKNVKSEKVFQGKIIVE